MKKRIVITREQLSRLRDCGLTRDQIARELSTSVATVKRRLAEYDLVHRRSGGSPEPAIEAEDRSPEAGHTTMERAKMRLGDRMGHGPRGYTLDGRPASVWDLFEAAGLDIAEPH